MSPPPGPGACAAGEGARLAGAADAALGDLLEAARRDGCAAVMERAYEVAAACHLGQRRRSGDPFITHPVEVARICHELGMGGPALCAALLHDVLMDTPYTSAQLRSDFGGEIAGLVEALTRLDQARYGSIAEAIDAAAGIGDQRVLIIKLADRLHNMRTLHHLPPAAQQRKSREVLDGFAPLARHLGRDKVARELADLAHAALARNRQDPVSQAGPALARPPALSRRLLALTAILLPAGSRDRWLNEWTAELSTLPTRRRRARFALQMLAGMPRLAVALRPPITSTKAPGR